MYLDAVKRIVRMFDCINESLWLSIIVVRASRGPKYLDIGQSCPLTRGTGPPVALAGACRVLSGIQTSWPGAVCMEVVTEVLLLHRGFCTCRHAYKHPTCGPFSSQSHVCWLIPERRKVQNAENIRICEFCEFGSQCNMCYIVAFTCKRTRQWTKSFKLGFSGSVVGLHSFHFNIKR